MNLVTKQFPPIAHERIMEAYGKWVSKHVNDGWDVFLLTFMFNQLPGPPNSKRFSDPTALTA